MSNVETSRIKVRERVLQKQFEDATGDHPDSVCDRPVPVRLRGLPDKLLVHHGIEPDQVLSVTIDTRCRKCVQCLRHRARLWTARAMDETKASTRTWFGTLTLAPDRQTWARYSALARMERRCSDTSDPDAVFAETARVIGDELQRFLKRLRKVAPLRFLLVCEAHKSGLPHFHALIHEYQGTITKRVLEGQWRFGFSHWRLVPPGDEQKVGYVCKYLAKSAQTRIRASQDYGQGFKSLLTERVEAATLAAAKVGAVIPAAIAVGEAPGACPRVPFTHDGCGSKGGANQE
ncbi:replication initiator protein [Flyfo microvirus Tbat2_171]|nr:replication initiator protein [Flyfo microvirus Tbat2_171]